MRRDGHRSVSLSGISLFFDRFGMIDGLGPDLDDPLAAARGIALGITTALLLWAAIGLAIGLL